MLKCALCPENDERILRKKEAHHVFGRAYSGDIILLCPNCHTKITSEQNALPPKFRSKKKKKENILYAVYSLFALMKHLGIQGMKLTKTLMESE